MRTALALIALTACATSTPTAPAEHGTTAAHTTAERSPTRAREPSRPSTTAQLERAREQCRLADSIRRGGTPEELEGFQGLQGAVGVLRRARAEDVRPWHGACLYTAGRLSESELRVDRARQLYDHSLRIRPNEIVRHHRQRLGERPLEISADHRELLVGEECPDCPPTGLLASGQSGDGPLISAAVVQTGGGYSIVMVGRDGEPGVADYVESGEGEQVSSVSMAFLPAGASRPWLLFVRLRTETSRCDGLIYLRESLLLVCTDRGGGPEPGPQCVRAPELLTCTDDASGSECASECPFARWRGAVRWTDDGLSFSGEGRLPRPSISVGTHPWRSLFSSDR